MTCRDVVEFLDRYRDGELSRWERARFQFHLALCANCRRYLASYEATIRLSKQTLSHAEPSPPGEVPEELVQAILNARRDRDGDAED
jgi:anti-sigma factor RsiW